jgi:hypothetical protein
VLVRKEKYCERTLLNFSMKAAMPGECEAAALHTWNQVVPKKNPCITKKETKLFGK